MVLTYLAIKIGHSLSVELCMYRSYQLDGQLKVSKQPSCHVQALDTLHKCTQLHPQFADLTYSIKLRTLKGKICRMQNYHRQASTVSTV
jgi:hypothetical protein